MSITIADEFIPGDYVAAVVARLRLVTNIMALCADETVGGKVYKRVSATAHPFGEPRHMVAVQAVGPGLPVDPPLASPRIQVTTWGGSGYEAMRLARLVRATLVPLSRQDTWFNAAGVVITNVRADGGPVPVPVPKDLTGWHCRASDFILLVNEGVRAA